MASRHVVVTLTPVYAPDTLPFRSLAFASNNDTVSLGRASKSESKNLVPAHDNGLFDTRVMSRDHAMLSVSLENETVFICDHGSTHGTLLNDQRIQPFKNVPVKSGDVLTFGSEVVSRQQTFRPLACRFDCKWHDRPTPAGTAKASRNTFTVPDDDDDDEDYENDESDIQISQSHLKPASSQPPAESGTDSSDLEYGSDISRPLDLTSPATSPEIKQSELPKPAPVESASESPFTQDTQHDLTTADQDPQPTRSSPPGSFPVDFGHAEETDGEFDAEIPVEEEDVGEDAISEGYEAWLAEQAALDDDEDSLDEEESLIYDDHDDEVVGAEHGHDHNEQVEEASQKATSPVEADVQVPRIVNEVRMNLPGQTDMAPETAFTAEPASNAINTPSTFAGPSVLDTPVVAPAAPAPPSYLLRQDTSGAVDFQNQLREYEMQRLPSPSDKAMARPPQYTTLDHWTSNYNPWSELRPTTANDSFPFGPHRASGYLRPLTSGPGPAQPFNNSQASENEKAAEPAKTGVSIADIVEASQPPASSGATKRKADEFESDLEESKLGGSSQENTQDTIPDAQPRPELNAIIVPDTQMPTSSAFNSRKEPRRKRVKTRRSSGVLKYATAAVLGAVVGSISTVAALAALPSDYFE